MKSTLLKINPKAIIWYELLVSILTLFGSFSTIVVFDPTLRLSLLIFLASIIGIFGAYYLLHNDLKGWYLSLIWAALQIPVLHIETLSFKGNYFLHMIFEFHSSFWIKDDWGLIKVGINWAGLLLLILFIKFKSYYLKIDNI